MTNSEKKNAIGMFTYGQHQSARDYFLLLILGWTWKGPGRLRLWVLPRIIPFTNCGKPCVLSTRPFGSTREWWAALGFKGKKKRKRLKVSTCARSYGKMLKEVLSIRQESCYRSWKWVGLQDILCSLTVVWGLMWRPGNLYLKGSTWSTQHLWTKVLKVE